MKDPYFSLKIILSHAFTNPELRFRHQKGVLKDQINFAVFEKTIHKYLDKKDLELALKSGLLLKEQIMEAHGQYKTIYVYTGKECHQVSKFKRFVNKLKFWS